MCGGFLGGLGFHFCRMAFRAQEVLESLTAIHSDVGDALEMELTSARIVDGFIASCSERAFACGASHLGEPKSRTLMAKI